MLPWLLCVILFILVLVLLFKVRLLQKSMDDIADGLGEHLSSETNVLISVSGRDRHARKLAAEINRHLRLLRRQRRRYLSGDMELKEAVTNISHDLRTPLTAIYGYLGLLEKEKQSGKAEQYIGIVRNRVDHMIRLTEELFRYSVILSADADMGREETVVVNHVLEESIASFYAALCERNIVPHLQISDQKVTRVLNREALGRIFSNLLNNAIKYSDGDLEITLSEDGVVTFTNAASGLDEVQVGKLFDRFYTVEAARKSTGLGLAIAKTLVEQMNGTISAQYENSRLCIRLVF